MSPFALGIFARACKIPSLTSVTYHETSIVETSRHRSKAKQLCRQVEQALQLILPSSVDAVIQNLMVIAVEPAPNTGRLQVTVVELSSTDATDRTIVLDRLAQANGWLRTQVAASIVRRRAPELVFVLRSK